MTNCSFNTKKGKVAFRTAPNKCHAKKKAPAKKAPAKKAPAKRAAPAPAPAPTCRSTRSGHWCKYIYVSPKLLRTRGYQQSNP